MKTKPYISDREYLRLEMIGEDEPRNAWIWVRRGVIGGAWTLVLFFVVFVDVFVGSDF